MIDIFNAVKGQLVDLIIGGIGIMCTLLSFVPRDTWIGQKLEWLSDILTSLGGFLKK